MIDGKASRAVPAAQSRCLAAHQQGRRHRHCPDTIHTKSRSQGEPWPAALSFPPRIASEQSTRRHESQPGRYRTCRDMRYRTCPIRPPLQTHLHAVCRGRSPRKTEKSPSRKGNSAPDVGLSQPDPAPPLRYLAGPPFGGKERKEVQQNFPIRTGETAFLFLQHFIKIHPLQPRPRIIAECPSTACGKLRSCCQSQRRLLPAPGG